MFDRHFFQPDWARLGKRAVNMMNMVREPIARIISGYYFRRRKWKNNLPLTWFKDFDSCVRDGDIECQAVWSTLIGIRVPIIEPFLLVF